MFDRLCFVLSMLWAAVMLWNFSTRAEHAPLSAFDYAFAWGPFLGWLVLRYLGRYVIYGVSGSAPRQSHRQP